MIPQTIKLEAGGAVCVTVIGSKVLLVVPKAGAVLTRAECEEVADALYFAGHDTECSDGPLVRGNSTPSAPQG